MGRVVLKHLDVQNLTLVSLQLRVTDIRFSNNTIAWDMKSVGKGIIIPEISLQVDTPSLGFDADTF